MAAMSEVTFSVIVSVGFAVLFLLWVFGLIP